MMPVQVVGTTAGGLVAAPGTVTLVPQINQVNGGGAPVPRGRVYGVPVWRYQGGASAIILDPVVGDLGMAFVAMRDISLFKATGAQANPGSFRRYNLADSIYVGAILGASPTSYLRFDASGGMEMVSPTTISLTVGGHSVVINSSGVTIDGKVFLAHTHSGVQTGSGDTGGVV